MIKKSWWVDFRANCTRYRKRSPDNTRQGALSYELLLRQKLARGELIDAGALQRKDLTFAEFVVKWFEDYVRPNNKYSEQLAKKYILSSSLLPFFGRKPVGQIRSHDIERYKAQQVQQGYANKTIMNRLTVLNKCLITAYEWLELEGAPPKIKWPKWTLPEIDYLSPEECELLLSHANGIMRELVLTALRTGMRQGELRGLQWSSIDWLTRTLAVRHSRDDYRKMLVAPKNNRTRHIPLDIDVYTMLYRRKKDTAYVFLGSDGCPFNNYRMNYAIRKLCRKAGFRTIGWHTLRHTFASHLAMRGVPLPAIKELMGHSTITTTMRYAHVAPSTLRAAIEMLNPKTMIATDCGQPVGNRWQEMQRSEAGQKTSAVEYA
jgi:integrase